MRLMDGDFNTDACISGAKEPAGEECGVVAAVFFWELGQQMGTGYRFPQHYRGAFPKRG